MSKREYHWNQTLWAIKFTYKDNSKSFIIGEVWDKIRPPNYEGEPTRPLLFWTRAKARKWIQNNNARYTKFFGKRIFKPIKVIQRIEEIIIRDYKEIKSVRLIIDRGGTK